MLELFKIFDFKLLEHDGSLGGDGGKKTSRSMINALASLGKKLPYKNYGYLNTLALVTSRGLFFLLSHKEEPVALVACEGTARQDTPL